MISDVVDRSAGRTETDPARLPLLDLIALQALDGDYVEAARRREEEARSTGATDPRRGPVRLLPLAVALAVFGGLLSLAFVQTRSNADVNSANRASLIRQVETYRGRLERQQRRLARLNTRVETLTQQVSDRTERTQAAALRTQRIGTSTGALPISGSGLRITVTEAPNADEVSEVHDQDLALLVNGLWEAGAEAVSVNGQRLTAVTAIRTSGAAIEVNGVGIGPPYTILAIGDRAVLEARLFDTKSGLDFVATANFYGFSYDLEGADRLNLPAAPGRVKRFRSAVTAPFGTGRGEETP